MPGNSIVFSIFLVFAGAALLSTVALYTRQSLLVVYMLLGVIIGPWGLRLLTDGEVIRQTGDVGIIFLLFLLGLNLHPQKLWYMLRKATWVSLISSLIFAVVGYGVGRLFDYSVLESVLVGAAMMFSSTIIGLKLLPTMVLNQRHTGEIMISILLMQDLIAIIVLLLLHSAGVGELSVGNALLIVLSLPALLLIAFVFERFVLIKLFNRFAAVQEYIFIVSIAWCLSMAELAQLTGLSAEIGAFIGGIAIATSPIALYIADNLKPLRDFFLVMFFFSIGAGYNLHYLYVVTIPAVLLGGLMLILKPVVFYWLLRRTHEARRTAWEVGVRLGQASEFALLVAYLAAGTQVISESASYLIQSSTILTFIISSYMVVFLYPTPLAYSSELRHD
ncbi:MAG: cation:proton antiporter domain-containing protein [Gammaproteobacteria bacterium]